MLYRLGVAAAVAFLLGCSSTQVNPLQDFSQLSNRKSAGERQRIYVNSLSCELMQNGSEEFQREHISALSGFAVGPRVSAEGQNPSARLLRPFTSDGCSSSPDGIPLTNNSEAWVDCCIAHDVAYWMGGGREQRSAADEQFRTCIGDRGYPRIGSMYKSFVETFGGPRSTQNYRWGYGWNFKRDYASLTAAEEAQIQTLYGVDSKKVEDVILAQDFNLQKVCDTFDPVFWGFRKEEVDAYQFLNRTLKKPDVIEWARWSYYNTEKHVLMLKLKSCAEPASLTFSSAAPISLQSSCIDK